MVTSLFPPSIGGIQSQTLALSSAMARHGANVHVVTRREGDLPAYESLGGVHVHRVGLGGASGPVATLAFVQGAVRKLVQLRREIGVVHAHQLLSPATVALAARPVLGVPVVLHPHACGEIGDVGVLSSTRLGRLRLAAAIRTADAFVAISGPIEGELRAAGVSPGRIRRIPNGVDLDRFRPALLAEKAQLRARLGLPHAPLVIYSGRLAREKGVDLLLDAWRTVSAAAPSARLWILGEGAERQRLLAQARELGVLGSVTFAGGKYDVAEVLRAADVAVLPSRTEGLPVALLEAMASGLPSVATAVGGSVEVLEDGRTGRLVSPEPAALARGLCEALGDDAASAWGRRAREAVQARYALDLVVHRHFELYAALRSPGARAAAGTWVGGGSAA